MPRGRPFQKGNRANPGGRPKGLARAVREEIGDPREWVGIMVAIAFDEQQKTSDRISAWNLLSQYGFGKPAEHALVEDADPLEIEIYRAPSEERVVELAQIVVDLERLPGK